MGSINRRQFIKASLAGVAGLSAGAMMPASLWADEPQLKKPAAGGIKATALIQVWLWGGMSHLDTFDPKPEMGDDIAGPYDEVLSSVVPGMTFNPLMTQLAQQAPELAVLRGLTHGVNGHETATYRAQTGRESGERLSWPGVGNVVSWYKRQQGQVPEHLPDNITLTKQIGRFDECGFLGRAGAAFATGGDPSKNLFAVEGYINASIGEQRRQARQQLTADLQRLSRMPAEDAGVHEWQLRRAEAFARLQGPATKVFDLSQEKDSLRERYGRNKLGQSCLAARRLVEAGVPMVTVNAQGWDTHKRHFESMNRMVPELDHALATLIADLKDRGLLETTLIWVGTEFGRTPKIQYEAPWHGGRGHYGKAFSGLLAGGGIKGGQVVGATDERGMEVVERPIMPEDVIGTIYRQLGVPIDLRLPTPDGGQAQWSEGLTLNLLDEIV